MSNHNSIIVLGAGKAIQVESKAAEAGIFPGHIVERESATTFLKCNANSTQAIALVAIENTYNALTKDDVYPNGDTVYARAMLPGMQFQARLAPAAVAVVFNDSLELDGDGGVKKAAAGVVKFKALEAVNNSAGGSSVFLLVEVI